MISKTQYKKLCEKYVKKKVKLIAGDYKNNTYVVKKLSKKGHLILDDLYCLNSKKKSYNWKVHYSNTEIQ